MWFQMMTMGMFGSFMPVLFMVGFWKCHYDILFCPRDHFYATYVCVGAIHELQMMSMGMFVPFLSVLFMVGVWKCHYDIWFCPRDHCVLEAYMWLQMMSMGMFVSMMSVLFMVGVWKCHYNIRFCPRDYFDATCLWECLCHFCQCF